MTAYTPSRLKLWSMPRHYFGPEWHGHYVAPCTRNRDSDSLEESNWRAQLEAVGGEQPDESVVVVRDRHFLCGWVEWLAIDAKATSALQAADRVAERLAVYPCLDEHGWEQLQVERGEVGHD